MQFTFKTASHVAPGEYIYGHLIEDANGISVDEDGNYTFSLTIPNREWDQIVEGIDATRHDAIASTGGEPAFATVYIKFAEDELTLDRN